jgi:type IV fimbrial biogenesis protein FimT
MSKPHTFTAHPCPQRGFTLVELLVAITVTAVLLLVAGPKLSDFAKSVKLTAASNTLLAHFHIARSEAIKRDRRVVLCKSADGMSCATTGGWEQGWIVFVDANSDGMRESAEAVILREERLSNSLRLTGNLNVVRYVSFAPTGATKLAGGGFQAGTLTLCTYSLEAGEARQIVLNAVGRPRVQRTFVTSCT